MGKVQYAIPTQCRGSVTKDKRNWTEKRDILYFKGDNTLRKKSQTSAYQEALKERAKASS